MPTDSFHTTRWTRVLAARGDSASAKAALSDLCEAYYAPVHAFIRASEGADVARDLTHAFFARLLERDALGTLERGRGKFRSYLLGAVKHFLRDDRARRLAQKRGGGDTVLLTEGIDGAAAESCDGDGTGAVPVAKPPDDALFDRHWALAVLQRALDALASSQGDPERFAALKPWLTGDAPGLSQAEVAARLHLSEGAVKVAIHRLRRRLRELVKREIAETLETESETELRAELGYLIRALSGNSS